MSTLDIIIDVDGLFWRCRSLNYAKNLNVTDEHGTGSLNPFALVNQEHTYSGTLTWAGFLVDNTPAMTNADRLALRKRLLDQQHEGRAKYFNIYTMEVPSHNISVESGNDAIEALQGQVQEGEVSFIEMLLNCKVTKFNRDFADKGTVVSSIDFKYMYSLPN
jgi:hypothetical protein